MEHDSSDGCGKNSLVLEELGFFDPVGTMDDMFCNANLMKELDFNAPVNQQYDGLFQDSVDGDSADRSENSPDFAVGEMFENMSFLWSVDELLCEDDDELRMDTSGARGEGDVCYKNHNTEQKSHFESEEREIHHPTCGGTRDLNSEERTEGTLLVNEGKDENIEGESMESNYHSLEKKLESISLVGSVNDTELRFNGVKVEENATIDVGEINVESYLSATGGDSGHDVAAGSCCSSGEKQSVARVGPETSPSQEIEEGEIVECIEDGISRWGEDEGDDDDYVFSSLRSPIRSKNEVEVLHSVRPVDIHLQDHHHTLPVGNVLSVIGPQVIVEGAENHHPLDEGSVLWVTNTRAPLGVVDEIFGPVKNPYYVVRYSSEDEVPPGLDRGDPVSYVPEFVYHVLGETALYQKGYDASGENDEEVSDGEFSDDAKEEEHRRRTGVTAKRTATTQTYRKGCLRKPRNGRPPRPRMASASGTARRFDRYRRRQTSRAAAPFPPPVDTPLSQVPSPSTPPFRPPPRPLFSAPQFSPTPRPFVFRGQQSTAVTQFQPAPPFSQWTASPFSAQQQQNGLCFSPMASPAAQPRQFQGSLAPPQPANQIVLSQPAPPPAMANTQWPTLPFSPRPPQASLHPQPAWVGPTVPIFQPGHIGGTTVPRPPNPQPNTRISQPVGSNPFTAPLNPHPAPPNIRPAPPNGHPAQPNRRPAQPNMNPAQPNMNPAQPNIYPAQPNVLPVQPNIYSPQPNMHTVQPNIYPAQPNIFPAQNNMNPAQPNMNPTQPNLHPVYPTQPNMNPAQPNMNPAQPNLHPVYPVQPNMHPAQPNMHPVQPNVYPAQPNVNPAQPNLLPAQRNLHLVYPAQPNMHPVQPNVYPAQPNMHTAQPNVHPAQPNMNPAQPNMHPVYPAQPNGYPAQPNTHPAQPNVYPVQQFMRPAQAPCFVVHPQAPAL